MSDYGKIVPLLHKVELKVADDYVYDYRFDLRGITGFVSGDINVARQYDESQDHRHVVRLDDTGEIAHISVPASESRSAGAAVVALLQARDMI